jgi:hypothetical protein
MFISKSFFFQIFKLKKLLGGGKLENFIAEWKRHPKKFVVEN